MKSNLDKLRDEMWKEVKNANDRGIQAIINETCEAILKDIEAIKTVPQTPLNPGENVGFHADCSVIMNFKKAIKQLLEGGKDD